MGGRPNATAAPGRSDASADLALTVPLFVAYHLGVVFLPIRNAADPVTAELRALAKQSLPLYAGLTVAIGVAVVLLLSALGHKKTLDASRFARIGLEGVLYAVLMRSASSYVVQRLSLAAGTGSPRGVFSNVVMALGAGFYEELAFRVCLFGLGAFLLRQLFGSGAGGKIASFVWALCAAAAFSRWHYVGELRDAWDVKSFVFRAVCGLALTTIYVFRGFAPAVWTHALYDLWVMVLG